MRLFARRLFALTGACLFVLFSVSTPAQEPPFSPGSDASGLATDDGAPAYLAVVDGMASIERDGSTERAEENEPLLSGDRLRTQAGRVEILFPDGSAIDVDEHSDVDLMSDSLLRLLAGRVRLSLARTAVTGAEVLEYRVDAEPGSAIFRTAGDYRVTLTGGQLQLAVLRGTAELQNSLGRTLVRAGMNASAASMREPSLPFAFNSASFDPFDRWVEDQRNARLSSVSSRYLPADIRYYGGTLDNYGSWSNEPGYGNVWYPRVDEGWRPYYSGRWSFAARLGWLWVGTDRWSWPTHHYGRWGLSVSDRWFWIPDRRWSAAWVTWGYTPDYVTWCPIGFNGSPVIGLADRRYSRGWSVVPLRSFRPNVIVPRHGVDARTFGPSLRAAVTVRNAAPVWRESAPSGSRGTPIRGPRAVRSTEGTGVIDSRRLPSEGVRQMPGARVERPATSPASRPELGPETQRFPRRQSPQAVPEPASRPESPQLRAIPRGEAPRVAPSSPRPESPRMESPRSEPPRPSSGVPGGPSRFEGRREAPRREAPRSEAPRPESPRSESPRVAPQPRQSAPPPQASPAGRERPSTGAQGAPSRVEGRPSGAAPEGRAVPRRRGGNDK